MYLTNKRHKLPRGHRSPALSGCHMRFRRVLIASLASRCALCVARGALQLTVAVKPKAAEGSGRRRAQEGGDGGEGSLACDPLSPFCFDAENLTLLELGGQQQREYAAGARMRGRRAGVWP